MSLKRRQSTLRSASQFVIDALAGRLGVLMMALSYGSLAVVMLAYVSAQVYTSSLMEDVAGRQEQRRVMEEKAGVLMSDYARLSSRARVSRYCEQKLGMVEGDVTRMVRVRVSLDSRSERSPSTSIEMPPSSEAFSGNLIGATGVLRQ